MSAWQDTSDSWGEEVKAAIEKKLASLSEVQSFNIGVPYQPNVSTRENITDYYRSRGYDVVWNREVDFGYIVVVKKL